MEHPIEGLMRTAMENLRSMIEVNTVVGDPVETPDGTVIIPVSRVACGFAAGGSAFTPERRHPEYGELPFGGGSGAGVSVQPVGFLVVNGSNVRLLPVEGNHLAERLVDLAPQVLERIEEMRRRDRDRQRLQPEVNPS
ncbi:GerW family sporulation protein [Ammonifex thiophilus]|uniref:Sporulation protein YtfJ n=1 Tax=Ammonifex thiophilus TaxID=444093 RepID=A0A3D8P5Z6_9THEO|nr:GerW family sporulation protein [Ammonifex thiophilus]RDV83946.1 sporulation protein YtfJ [Ammonifex thiophilus]